MLKKINFIDLCAGIGGFRVAFEKNNTNCVLTCEIDKFCEKTYHANFKKNLFESNITLINEELMPKFDILCAGFPCQAFSLAGKQDGFSDEKGRGTIFFDIVRILDKNRPKSFLLENVKNLKSHDKGNTFKVITKKLTDLNYWHYTFTINAKYFVPQKRERIYILGVDKNYFSKEKFDNLVKEINLEYEQQKLLPLIPFVSILEDNVNLKYTLSDKLWNFLQEHSKKHAKAGNGFGYNLMNPSIDITARTLTARYYKDGAEILVKQEGKNPRKLTPRECARIMGYPDTFKIVNSDTQSYKQFGNSVVVPVVAMFSKKIEKFLNEN